MTELLLKWLILQSVWASILVAVIALLKLVFKSRLGAVWEYGIWSLLLIRIAIPPLSIFESDLSYFFSALNISRLLIVWVCGVLAVLAYTFLINIIFWIKVKNGIGYHNPEVLSLLEDSKQELGIRTNITIVQTSGVSIPALFGLIRPWILLPEWAGQILSKEELRYVLLHELAHLKRMDIAFNWVSLLIQTVFWFNPLIWYGMNCMKKDREVACDATVLEAIQPFRHIEYGKTILRVVELFSRPYKLAGVAGILEKKSEVEHRLKMIAAYHKRKNNWQPALIAVLTVLLFVVPERMDVLGSTYTASKTDKVKTDVKATAAYMLKDILIKPEYGIDIEQYQLAYTTSKAELWTQGSGLPQKSLERLKRLMDIKIPEIEKAFETTVDEEIKPSGKIVYLITTGNVIPKPYGSRTIRTVDLAVVIIDQSKIAVDSAVELMFVQPTVRVFLPASIPGWASMGASYYLASMLRSGGEGNLVFMDRNARNFLYSGNTKVLELIGKNSNQSFDNSFEKDGFNFLSGSFCYYLEKKLGRRQMLEIYRSERLQGELERRSGKAIGIWKDEWLQELKKGE